jgi:hypothetical protein
MSFDWQQKYNQHRNSANSRGIPFILSFKQWMGIWERSGVSHKRGRKKGQFVMARLDDEGPYAVGNVEIILNEENSIGGNVGREVVWSAKTKAKISASLKGVKHSEQRKRNIALGHTGLKQKQSTIEKRIRKVKKTWNNPGKRAAHAEKIRLAWKRKKGLL